MTCGVYGWKCGSGPEPNLEIRKCMILLTAIVKMVFKECVGNQSWVLLMKHNEFLNYNQATFGQFRYVIVLYAYVSLYSLIQAFFPLIFSLYRYDLHSFVHPSHAVFPLVLLLINLACLRTVTNLLISLFQILGQFRLSWCGSYTGLGTWSPRLVPKSASLIFSWHSEVWASFYLPTRSHLRKIFRS